MKAEVNWLLENTDIILHPGVNIDNSDIGGEYNGVGIFFDRKYLSNSSEKTIELVRVPNSVVYSLKSLSKIISDYEGQIYESNEQFVSCKQQFIKFVERFINHPLHDRVISDTNMVILHIMIIKVLNNQGFNVKPELNYYIDNILLKTKIYTPCNLGKDEKLFDKYYGAYRSQLEILFIKILKEIFKDFLDIPFICQLYSAIKSRSLEIPQELESESDDFIVDISLVPILDFANHHNKLRNAFFDVDRSTGDVLLLLEKDYCQGNDSKIEIFISYSPVEEIFMFENTYGFVTQPDHDLIQFFNLALDTDFLNTSVYKNINLCCFFEQMNINPSIQIILYKGHMVINNTLKEYGEILLPFINHPTNPDISCFHFDTNKSVWVCSAIFQEESNTVSELILSKEQLIDFFFTTNDNTIYERANNELRNYLILLVQSRVKKIQSIMPRLLKTKFANLPLREIPLLKEFINQLHSPKNLFWFESFGSFEIQLPKVPLPILHRNNNCDMIH